MSQSPFRPLLAIARISAVFIPLAFAHAGATVHLVHASQAKAAGCDYYVITVAAFMPQAERLAALRHTASPEVAKQPCIAKMEDVYKDYAPRQGKWTSLQDFLKAAFVSSPSLAHVALLGSASFDPASPDDRVPTYTQLIRSLTRFSLDTVYYDTLTSDDVYSAYFDTSVYDQPGYPMAYAVGRIPARTAAQADAYLDKLEAYETHFAYGPNAFTYGYLNDDDWQHGNRFDVEPIWNMPAEHLDLWDSLRVKPFVRRMLSIEFPMMPDWTKPKAKDSTLGLINSGPARVYFIGHGHPTQLTDEKIYESPADLPRLAAKRLQPIISMLACTTARFAQHDTESMGVDFLFHPNGAVAFLGGTIPTYPGPNKELFRAWDRLTEKGGTLGGTFARAKAASIADIRNNSAYVVLGDPALTVHAPVVDLAPASGSNPGSLLLNGAGAVGDSAYFQLLQIDSIEYNPILNPENSAQRNGKYPRERVLGEGRAALGAGGSVTFALPRAESPDAAAVKVMTWNTKGMRYGHFPLSALGVAIRPVAKGMGPGSHPGYRLMLRGERLVLEGNGRRIGLDGRAEALPSQR